MQTNCLVMEYPGYGLYKGYTPNESQILADIESVLDYCINVMEFKKEKIIVIGKFPQTRKVNWVWPSRAYSLTSEIMLTHIDLSVCLNPPCRQKSASRVSGPDVREATF